MPVRGCDAPYRRIFRARPDTDSDVCIDFMFLLKPPLLSSGYRLAATQLNVAALDAKAIRRTANQVEADPPILTGIAQLGGHFQ